MREEHQDLFAPRLLDQYALRIFACIARLCMQDGGERGTVLERSDHLVDDARQSGKLQPSRHLVQRIGQGGSGADREHHLAQLGGELTRPHIGDPAQRIEEPLTHRETQSWESALCP